MYENIGVHQALAINLTGLCCCLLALSNTQPTVSSCSFCTTRPLILHDDHRLWRSPYGHGGYCPHELSFGSFLPFVLGVMLGCSLPHCPPQRRHPPPRHRPPRHQLPDFLLSRSHPPRRRNAACRAAIQSARYLLSRFPSRAAAPRAAAVLLGVPRTSDCPVAGRRGERTSKSKSLGHYVRFPVEIAIQQTFPF